MGGSEIGKGHRVTAELRAYWEGLRKGGPVPARSAVDPRGIERALEYAFILERIAPGMARFRLAGMHLNDLMGMEVRGMPLTAFFAPVGRKRIAEVLEGVFNGPEVAELTLTAETGIGKPALGAKLLILPMKSDLGDVNRALGCLIADGPIGRSPRRFTLAATQISPIIAGSPVQRGLPQPVAPRLASFAEAQQGYVAAPNPGAAPSMTPEARRALLRVVSTNDQG